MGQCKAKGFIADSWVISHAGRAVTFVRSRTVIGGPELGLFICLLPLEVLLVFTIDISGEDAEVQAVANSVWTDAVKAAWADFKANQTI